VEPLLYLLLSLPTRLPVRRESIIATPDPSLSLSLLRDEQKVSLGGAC
jgi:hypothetical protein